MKKKNIVNSPTEIGQRVKLRGRPAYGEVVAWWPAPFDFELNGRKVTWTLTMCTVAWDWEAYLADPPIKGLVWGYITPKELELV